MPTSDPERTPGRGIGVVVLNFNGAAHLAHCLSSLRSCSPAPRRVVVVDNGSTDSSGAIVRRWAQEQGLALTESSDDEPPLEGETRWLHLITVTRHRGCSGGNNVGLRALLRDPGVSHFLMLDNDTEVAPDYFGALGEALDCRPDAGMISGTILDFHDRSSVQYAGGDSVPWRALVRHRYHVPADPRPSPTDFVTGCAMVVSRELLERVGPMPECYFPVYVEDAEYSFRARAAGLPVLYAPRPVVYHKMGSTVGRAPVSPAAKYMETRHRAFYVRRNFRGLARLAGTVYLIATKPTRAAVELLRGRPAMASAYFRGIISGLTSSAARQEPPALL